MAKKKKDENLTPVPTPKKRPGAEKPMPKLTSPDLSYIAEGLRPLAVPISEIYFDPANARLHGEKNIKAIEGSLHVYGQRKPIIVNRRENNVTEAGNGTLQAALNLGWKNIAVLFVDDDPATAAGFKIADNRTAELASWDDKALQALLGEVSTKNDARLDEMMSELAADLKLIPVDERLAPLPSTALPGQPAPQNGQPYQPQAGEPYQPILDPAQSQNGVTPEDMQEAAEDMQERIESQPNLHEVICPKCAEQFFVDPQLLLDQGGFAPPS